MIDTFMPPPSHILPCYSIPWSSFNNLGLSCAKTYLWGKNDFHSVCFCLFRLRIVNIIVQIQTKHVLCEKFLQIDCVNFLIQFNALHMCWFQYSSSTKNFNIHLWPKKSSIWDDSKSFFVIVSFFLFLFIFNWKKKK